MILSVVKWPITIFFTKHMGLDGSYFHQEGVIELFRAEVFPEFLSQRAQPEGSNYPENPRPEKIYRPSGEQCF